ncbi:hypothetical protein [Paracoccus marinus]|uniref:hypothetical protein n=1 Tax=Paracoccus marinus TaxID=288426 RepID=UPI00103C10E0|nr:hypothetical protein [Paracoccus marinus]GLS80098.1 hypothetical protein GCM10007893_08760 [Paracoccus marinus]
MRHSFLAVTAAALALSGCVAAVPVAPTPVPTAPIVVAPPAPSVASGSRAAATRVVNIEMAKRLPGRNVAPYTSCVLDNATDAEIADLSTLSGQASAADAVANIVRRSGTTACIGRVAVA